MADPADVTVYDALKREIALQVRTLRSGAPVTTDRGARTAAEIEQHLQVLAGDFELVVRHSRLRMGVARLGQFICGECGQARHCELILGLHQTYRGAVTYWDPSDSGSTSDDLERWLAES